MYATNYFETGILNSMRGVTLTAPAKLYVGLFLTSPGETGAEGTEVNYSGYVRKEITFSTPAAESGGIGIQNLEQITFPTSPDSAGTIKYIGLYDSPTAGNAWVYGELVEGNTILPGVAPVILAGEVKYWLTGNMTTYFKTAVLNVLRGQNIPGVALYHALYSGDPEAAGGELTGENYERQLVTFAAPELESSGQSTIKNSVRIVFPRPTTAWGTWAYDVYFDAASNGHALWKSQKANAISIKAGYMPMVEVGSLTMAVN